MAITDPKAIKYSNEYTRRIADRLCQRYYLGKSVADQWGVLDAGDDQVPTDALNPEITQWANLALGTYLLSKDAAPRWASYANVLIPSGGGAVDDGSPEDGRPAADADAVRLINARMNDQITDLEDNNNAKLNTIVRVLQYANSANLDATFAQVCVTRMNEIVSDLEQSNDAKLNQLLSLAVNPLP